MRPFISLSSDSFLKDSFVLLVLRVLSLFNLQGAIPSPRFPCPSEPVMRNSVILPRLGRFVKYFFLPLRNFFTRPAPLSSAPLGAQLIYQTAAPLSTPNFAFFHLFFSGRFNHKI